MHYVNQKQCKDGWYTKFTDCRGYWYRRNKIGSFKFIAPFTHVSIYFLHCIYSILISCLQVNLEFFTSLRQQKIINSIEGPPGWHADFLLWPSSKGSGGSCPHVKNQANHTGNLKKFWCKEIIGQAKPHPILFRKCWDDNHTSIKNEKRIIRPFLHWMKNQLLNHFQLYLSILNFFQRPLLMHHSQL